MTRYLEAAGIVLLFALAAWAARADGIKYNWSNGTMHDDATYTWGLVLQSYVRLYPVEGKDHVAEVEFKNASMHNTEVIAFTLSADGLSVTVTADTGKGQRPDFIDVEAPDGFIAVPFSISVAEGETGRVLIYPRKSLPAT